MIRLLKNDVISVNDFLYFRFILLIFILLLKDYSYIDLENLFQIAFKINYNFLKFNKKLNKFLN
jgi:hypothetical protein